jgi:hypothetical protein
MQCPNCGYLLDDLDPTCPRCAAQSERAHEEAVQYVMLHTEADAATARTALEATAWNANQAIARLGRTPPAGSVPPASSPAPRGPAAASSAPSPTASTTPKQPGFGTPGTKAHKAVVGVGIAVGVLVLAGVVFVCLGLFGVAGPIRKPKVAQSPPPGTPPEVTMDAEALWDEYATSKAQAQSKFAGKFAQVSGCVRGIESGKTTAIIVSNDPGGLSGAKCYLAPDQAAQGAKLAMGQPVVVQGMIDDFAVHVKLRDCRIAQAGPPPAEEPQDQEPAGGGSFSDE